METPSSSHAYSDRHGQALKTCSSWTWISMWLASENRTQQWDMQMFNNGKSSIVGNFPPASSTFIHFHLLLSTFIYFHPGSFILSMLNCEGLSCAVWWDVLTCVEICRDVCWICLMDMYIIGMMYWGRDTTGFMGFMGFNQVQPCKIDSILWGATGDFAINRMFLVAPGTARWSDEFRGSMATTFESAWAPT